MIVNLGKYNVYATTGITKTSSATLKIQGAVNCNGNMSIQGGDNQITEDGQPISYAISCAGNLTLNNGSSNNDIYYKGTLQLQSAWNTTYNVIQFNDLPGFQATYDLIGYLKYLLSLATTGKDNVVGTVCNLTGRKTKSINVHEISRTNLANATEIKIGPYAASSHLIKVDSPLSAVTMTNLVMNGTGVKPSANDVLFAIDAPVITITGSTIIGSIYAPNSDIIINGSTITGTIFAKTVTFTGTANIQLNNAPFNGYIESPVAPEIRVEPNSTINNYDALIINVVSDDAISDYYEIRYTLDGKDPTRSSTLYTGPFELFQLGIVTVTAKIFGNGVEDGGTASQAYGFKCKTDIPALVKTYDVLNDITVYSISSPSGSEVYFTLDGSTPVVKPEYLYVESEFNSNFDSEGEYNLRFIAHVNGCDDSEIVDESFIVKLPISTGVLPPKIQIFNSDDNQIQLIDPALYPLKTTFVIGAKPIGEAPDPSVVELRTDLPLTIQDVEGLNFLLIRSTLEPTSAKYSVDGSNPINGLEYDYNSISHIPMSTLVDGRFRAFSHLDYKQFSNQIDYTILFRTTDSERFDTSAYELRSEEVLDSLQAGSNYALDIAWVGPGVVTDDFAVYQALVNILATDMLERIFNPSFGVSISSKLAEVHELTSGDKVISDLKVEIEIQDSRIFINDELSYTYFDESIGALVVNLVWMNRITKNSAVLKYAYDLDTIR